MSRDFGQSVQRFYQCWLLIERMFVYVCIERTYALSREDVTIYICAYQISSGYIYVVGLYFDNIFRNTVCFWMINDIID